MRACSLLVVAGCNGVGCAGRAYLVGMHRGIRGTGEQVWEFVRGRECTAAVCDVGGAASGNFACHEKINYISLELSCYVMMFHRPSMGQGWLQIISRRFKCYIFCGLP